ncbi:hypothetical protein J6590_029293 [Homalodisca vitripennis]|nr:hypothetical protein J6590_029293 [Homalodisca vitripennis]
MPKLVVKESDPLTRDTERSTAMADWCRNRCDWTKSHFIELTAADQEINFTLRRGLSVSHSQSSASPDLSCFGYSEVESLSKVVFVKYYLNKLQA